VRLELARALERDVPVIPVLVDGTLLPDHDQLPGDIADLVFRGSVELAHHRFDRDFDFLVERLERLFDAERESEEQAARLEAEEEARREAEEEARIREAELARREAEEEAATSQRQAEEAERREAVEVGRHQAVEAAGEAEEEPRGDLEEGRRSEAPSRWDRKRFGLVAVVVALIAGLAAVVVVLATTGGDDTPSTTAAAPTVATDPGTATDPAAGTKPGAGTEPTVAGVDLAGTAVTVLGLQLEDHRMEAVREVVTAPPMRGPNAAPAPSTPKSTPYADARFPPSKFARTGVLMAGTMSAEPTGGEAVFCEAGLCVNAGVVLRWEADDAINTDLRSADQLHAVRAWVLGILVVRVGRVVIPGAPLFIHAASGQTAAFRRGFRGRG